MVLKWSGVSGSVFNQAENIHKCWLYEDDDDNLIAHFQKKKTQFLGFDITRYSMISTRYCKDNSIIDFSKIIERIVDGHNVSLDDEIAIIYEMKDVMDARESDGFK